MAVDEADIAFYCMLVIAILYFLIPIVEDAVVDSSISFGPPPAEIQIGVSGPIWPQQTIDHHFHLI